MSRPGPYSRTHLFLLLSVPPLFLPPLTLLLPQSVHAHFILPLPSVLRPPHVDNGHSVRASSTMVHLWGLRPLQGNSGGKKGRMHGTQCVLGVLFLLFFFPSPATVPEATNDCCQLCQVPSAAPCNSALSTFCPARGAIAVALHVYLFASRETFQGIKSTSAVCVQAERNNVIFLLVFLFLRMKVWSKGLDLSPFLIKSVTSMLPSFLVNKGRGHTA